MTDLKQFTSDAIRTESVKQEITVNHDLLINTLRAYIAIGGILDQIKKGMFYGSKYDLEKYGSTMSERLDDAYTALFELNELVEDPNSIPESKLEGINPRIVHALIGTATESTELMEALERYVDEGSLDTVNVSEEYGDIAWYTAIFFDESKINWDDSLDAVISKLKARYPEKFTQQDAENRDLAVERAILEQVEQ